MANLDSVVSRSPSIVPRKTGKEYVLVPVTDNIADMNSVYTLNETGAFLWEKIDGKRTVRDLIREMTNEYKIDKKTATRDVLWFIEDLSNYLIIR